MFLYIVNVIYAGCSNEFPREENSLADKLAIAASTLQPIKELINGNGKMQIKFIPSTPDNLDHWKKFKNYHKILRFIHNVQEFSDFQAGY